MKYSIIAIGDELLAGQVTDTNSGMIARMLEPHGWELAQVWTVSDEPERILAAMESAFALTDVVLTTGGLGPTKDDLTKQTLCRYFGGELREDPAVLDNVRRIIAARSLTLNKLTAAQAMVPTSCRVIQNRVGTAPLMWFERDGKVLVAMPGVPFETEQMMRAEVIDRLVERFPSEDALARRVVMVHSMSESAIAEMLAKWEDSLPEYAHLAYLPTPGVVRLRIDGRHSDGVLLQAEMERLHRELTERIPAANLLATA
ncbi:MAG: damage-inducible protein CinA, partial [Muribaculaceae bacterium]|nr:damage-inducible protein CinA [Muribaculaceae bacterium]